MVDHFTLMLIDVFTCTFGISGGAVGSMMGIWVIAAKCSSSRCKSDAVILQYGIPQLLVTLFIRQNKTASHVFLPANDKTLHRSST